MNKANLEMLSSKDDERTFEAFVTVDVVDKQGDRLDPEGFTVDEYLNVLGGPIMDSHSNVKCGEFSELELREHPKTGKRAWYGKGRIYGPNDAKGKSYPVWDEVWSFIKSNKNAGVSIGGDPDWDGAPPRRECVGGTCYRLVPKTFLHEVSVVRSAKGPANPEALITSFNKFAKGPEGEGSHLLKQGGTHSHGARETIILDPTVVGEQGKLGGEPVRAPSNPGVPKDAKVPHIQRPVEGLDKAYSVEETADHPFEMAVKSDQGQHDAAATGNAWNDQSARTSAGAAEGRGQVFGSLTLSNATQDFRDGGIVAPNEEGLTKTAGSWDQKYPGTDPYRGRDISPTDAQMASTTGLVTHGGPRYEGEARPADAAEARHLDKSGTMLADAGDPEGFHGEVGSMGGLRVSQTNVDRGAEDPHVSQRHDDSTNLLISGHYDEDEDMSSNLLRKAGQLTKMESREVAIASISYDLRSMGLTPGMAKGIAIDLSEGDERSLRKALKAGLLKDHGEGYAWDPDEENAKRPRLASTASGNIPTPTTGSPEWRPGQKQNVASPHGKVSESFAASPEIQGSDEQGTNTHFPVNNPASQGDDKGNRPPMEKAACGCHLKKGDIISFTHQDMGRARVDGVENDSVRFTFLQGSGGGWAPASVIRKEAGPVGETSELTKPMPGMSVGAGMPPDSSPHRDMTQKMAKGCACRIEKATGDTLTLTKADDEDKKRPERPNTDSEGKGAKAPPGIPGAGEKMGAQDGGKEEGRRPPDANLAQPDAQALPKEMPQAMGASTPPPMGESGFQSHPQHMGPGQPDAVTSLPPGMVPSPHPGTTDLLNLLTPDEQDAIIQLLLGMNKVGAPQGSPLTTATPGAYQPRLEQDEEEENEMEV